MDPKGYLYAAEMTDLLTAVVEKDRWDDVLIPELGSLSRLFAHMIRVRDIYRDGLLTGRIDFSRTFDAKVVDVEAELVRSRNQLAEAIATPRHQYIHWGNARLTAAEICSAAIQHEGIHQGQWYVACKQAGYNVPNQWQFDWHLQ